MDIAADPSRQHPFGPDVDPEVFYRSPIHERVRVALVDAAGTHAGLLILLGAPGTGKTAVLHRVVRDLEQAGARVLRSSALRPPHEMFRSAGEAPSVVGASFHAALRSRVRSERATVVAVDDAERLTLTELRFFRDIAAAERQIGRRLTILLVGRPAFDVKLTHLGGPAGQGIVVPRVLLMPLDTADVPAYMACRLQHVGWSLEELFEPEAVERVVAYAEGLPRRVNQLCYAALHTATEAGLARVAASSVEAAADWLDFGRPSAEIAAEPVMEKWVRGLATTGGWVRPAAARVGAMALAAVLRVEPAARTGTHGIAVAATRLSAWAVRVLGVALAAVAHGLGHATRAGGDAMGAAARRLAAMAATTGRGLVRATRRARLDVVAAGETLRVWAFGVVVAVTAISRSFGEAVRAGARGVASAGGTLRPRALGAAAAAAAAGQKIGRGGRACAQGVAAAGAALRRRGLDGAAAAVATSRSTGHGLRAGGDRVVAAATMMWVSVGSSVRAGLARVWAGVGRGLTAGARGFAAAVATLWVWSRSIASALAAAGRGLGRLMWAGGRRVVSVRATLGIWMRGVIEAVASGRTVGRAGWASQRGLGSARTMLRAVATNARASVLMARHRVRRVGRMSVEGMAPAVAVLWAWSRRTAVSIAASSRTSRRSIGAWVTRHAAPTVTSLRAVSPGAVVAVLSLVVFTLVMVLWPMSYEPPTPEWPPPSDRAQSSAQPSGAEGKLSAHAARPSGAEGKPPARVGARGGARRAGPPVSYSSVAREPVTFATARPPSDR